MWSPFFTVFTPTYNRAHTLRTTYESLLRQTFRDFEWIVVDDGSEDHTRELIQEWCKEAWFPIRYFHQQHMHKKVAFNRACREAAGYLLADLDSDDEFLDNTLQVFYDVWHGIPADQREFFIGVTGLCVYEDGQVVGDLFPRDLVDATVLDMNYYRWRVKGDKSGCMRVDVLRRFPFPEDVEGFVPESIVWDSIARAGYLTRFVNIPVLKVNRTPNSLSRVPDWNIRYALGLGMWTAATLDADLAKYFFRNPIFFIKLGAGLTRYQKHLRDQAKDHQFHLTSRLARALVTAVYPLGVVMYYRDRWRRKKNERLRFVL